MSRPNQRIVRLPRNNPVEGLPLPPVDLGQVIYPVDLVQGSVWPPRRMNDRVRRMDTYWQVANTYLQGFVKDLTAPVNHYQPLIDYSQALLLDSEPTASGVDDSVLAEAVATATFDLYTYGRALFVRFPDGSIMQPDMRLAYPLAVPGENWVVTVPQRTADDTGRGYSIMDMWIILGNRMAGVRRRFESTARGTVPRGTLGDIVTVYPTMEVAAAHADRPGNRQGWGKPIVEPLLPIMIEMNRAEERISLGLDRGERSILTADALSHDIPNSANRMGAPVAPGADGDDADTYQALQEAIGKDDIIVQTEGTNNLRFINPTVDVQGSMSQLAYLSQKYTQLTGMAPVEASDANDRTSGVAVARRQRALILKNRAIFNAQQRALRILFPDLEWEYVDDRLDAGIGELEGDQGRGQGSTTAAMEASA